MALITAPHGILNLLAKVPVLQISSFEIAMKKTPDQMK
jgi:hypothetical protein